MKKQKITAESLSAAQKKIRKNWCRSALVFFSVVVAIYVGSCLLVLYGEVEEPNQILLQSEIVAAAMTFHLAAMFYFAYVRFGTKWIGFFVFSSPLGIIDTVKEIIEMFNAPDSTAASISGELIFHLSFFSLFAYFWFNCFRLYELNKALKKRTCEQEEVKLELVQQV